MTLPGDIGKRLTVDQYDHMVSVGILPETNRLELVEGRIVEKARQTPPQVFSSESCRGALASLVPSGWHVRCQNPVRVPSRDSEPEPDVSVVRRKIRDYCDHHPAPRTSPCAKKRAGVIFLWDQANQPAALGAGLERGLQSL